MARVSSPLDPRVEARFVADPELDAILREIVEPDPASIVNSWELRAAIRDLLGLHVDGVRLQIAMDRVLEPASDTIPATRSAMACGRLRQELTAHQRLRIRNAA